MQKNDLTLNSMRHWQLNQPIDAIVFDCDGTLSAIEGIDYLASYQGVTHSVSALTKEAMNCGLTPELFARRLNLVKPNRKMLIDLAQAYFSQRSSFAKDVIQLFQEMHKEVYLVSAGLSPAVHAFGQLLGVKSDNIFAVDISFNSEGLYADFDRQSPLIHNLGKQLIIHQLKQRFRRIAHVGDGMNDIIVRDLVDRFVGYGGSFYREHIAQACNYYITSATLAPLAPLLLTEAESKKLSAGNHVTFTEGIKVLQQGGVKINTNL